MQETASWMWSHFDEYKPGTNFGAWGVQVARYKILKLNNQRANPRVRFNSDVVHLLDAEAEPVFEKISPRMQALEKCLSGLCERDRQLLFLRYEQGLTVKKMAQLMERPIQGIYKTMARVHKLLFRCVRQTVTIEEMN